MWGRKKEVVDWFDVEQKNPNIRYKGAKHKRELSIAMNRSALCIVPSMVPEGFTRVSLEAQACGCPVVCTAAGGLPETIVERETGCVVPQTNHESLVKLLKEILPDSSRLLSMSIKATEHAKKFSVESSAQAFMKLAV